jgi:hypothetical protein
MCGNRLAGVMASVFRIDCTIVNRGFGPRSDQTINE